MSDLQKTIEIIFSGVDQLSGPMGTMSSDLTSFAGQVEAVAEPLARVGDAVLKVDAVLAALAAGGLVYAFNASKDYEQATIELQKVMGDGETVTDEMMAKFTELSRTYGESTTTIISSLAELRQSGFNTAEGIEILTASLMLNRASELSTEEATNLLKRTLIGYKLEVEDTIRVGDLWNHASQVTNTNVSKLAEAFAIVSRQAADSGFSMEQTAAVLAPIIGVFDSGSEAGIAFSTALARMIDPTKEGEAAIRMLTGATGPLNEEFANGRELFEAVAEGLTKVDDQTGAVAVAQIVGIQQAKRIKVAFDDYNKTLVAIGPEMDRYNSLQKEVDLQNESATASVERLIAGFNELAISIGNQFRAAAVEAIDGGTAIENALQDLVDEGTFAPVFKYLNEFGIEVGNFLRDVAQNLPEAFEGIRWDPLLDALDAIGESVGELFDGVDLSTPEGLREVIQRVIDSLGTLGQVTAGMIQGWKPFIDSILGIIDSLNKMDAAEQQSTGNILGLAQAIDRMGAMVVGAMLLMGENADKLSFIFSTTVRTLSGAFDAVVIAWNGVKVLFYEVVIDLLETSKMLTHIPGFGFLEDDVQANIDTLTAWKNAAEANMLDAADSASKNLTGIQTDFRNTSKSVDLANEDTKGWLAELEKIPGDKQTRLDVEADPAGASEFSDMLHEKIPEEMLTNAKVDPDQPSIDNTEDIINGAVPEEKKTDALVIPNKPSIDATKSAINEIPESKLLEIQLQGDIDIQLAEIKAQADRVQTAFEWSAKVNIAQAEADAKRVVAAFEAASEAVTATAAAAADMYGSLLDNWEKLGWVEKRVFEQYLKEQMAMEQQALDMQERLTDAQTEYMNAKADALRDGEGLIKIESDGLEPALEMIMWQILEKVQLRVNEESAEFLLGLNPAGA